MRLSVKFSFFSIIIGILLIGVITITAERVFVRGIENLILDTNLSSSQNVAAQFETYISHVKKSMKIYAKPSIFSSSQDEFDNIQSLLSDDIDALMLLDSKGIFTKLGSKYKAAVGKSVNNLSQFKKIQNEEITMTNVITVFGEPAFAIASVIHSEYQPVGIMAGAIFVKSNQTLANLFREKKFGKEGYIAVIDGQGDVIFHSDSSRIMTGRNTPPDTLELIKQGGGKKIITNRFGEKLLAGLSPIKNTTWNVMVLTPIKEVDNIRYELFSSIFIVAGLLSVFLIALSPIVIKKITLPLEKITDAFAKLEKRQYIILPEKNTKDEFQSLSKVYNNTVEQLKRYHEELESQSEKDGLTGMMNRRMFDLKIESIEKHADGHKSFPLSVLMIDIDNFKSYNDTLGHIAGDELLRKISQIMRESIPYPVYRFGGEEFAVILENTSIEETELVSEILRAQIEQANLGRTVSIGMGFAKTALNSFNQVIDTADRALYKAKLTKNSTSFFECSTGQSKQYIDAPQKGKRL